MLCIWVCRFSSLGAKWADAFSSELRPARPLMGLMKRESNYSWATSRGSWALFAGGLMVFCLAALPRYVHEYRSTGWPTTQGVVTQREVHHGHWRGTDIHSPRIEYRYSVRSRTLTGNRTLFHIHAGLEVAAENALAPYPQVGGAVIVYYDPDDPADAVLRPGLGSEQWILLWMSVSLAAVSFIACIGLGWPWLRIGGRLTRPTILHYETDESHTDRSSSRRL